MALLMILSLCAQVSDADYGCWIFLDEQYWS